MSKQRSGIYLLFFYAKQIAKERGFGKGRFFFLRSLLFPTHSANWLEFIDKYFKKIGFLTTPWDIVSTPLRLCFSNHLNAESRIKILCNHYEILEEFLPHPVIHDLMLGKAISLANIVGKDGQEYEFDLSYSGRWRREGMLTVIMRDKGHDNLVMTSMTFIFYKNGNSNALLIGGLQGISDLDNGKSAIVKSTRNLNGLRPKYAVLNCVYAIAKCFDVKEIVATSEKNHPVKLTNKRRNRSFFAEYNIFWQELEGKLNADGNFILPMPLPKRNIEDVPSKKKKDWLARHGHVQKMVELTQEKLQGIFK